MPNIEIKAKCNDLEHAKTMAMALATDSLGILHQIDTYFETKKGRLKLREINGKRAQLIPYYKEYQTGPMKSNYALLDTSDPDLVKTILDKLLGIIAIIDKKREVYLIDNIRVHLDKVKGLGEFIEFEAVYRDESDRKNEERKVRALMAKFNVSIADLLDRSYIDYQIHNN